MLSLFLTFNLLVKIMILPALLAVSMPTHFSSSVQGIGIFVYSVKCIIYSMTVGLN